MPEEDFGLPLQAITLHTVCELQYALQHLELPPDANKPKNWPQKYTASIQLVPKVDTDFNPSVGLTGSSKGPNSNTFSNSWTMGSGGGTGVDVKSAMSTPVVFYLHFADLLDSRSTLDCTKKDATNHALAQDLGIHRWLQRLALAANYQSLGRIPPSPPKKKKPGDRPDLGRYVVDWQFLDKSTFDTSVTIKMSANGAFTYTFPFGTDLGSLSGSYQLDEKLTIVFAEDKNYGKTDPPTRIQFPPRPDEKTKTVPYGGQFFRYQGFVPPAPIPRGVSDETKSVLDNLQVQQTLRNLRP